MVFFIKLLVFIINNSKILNKNVMDNKLDNTLNNFLEDETQEKVATTQKPKHSKKIRNKDGLIERVDKKLIVEDGRQMLLD